MRIVLALSLAAAACGGVEPTATPDATPALDAAEAVDAAIDSPPPDAPAASCDVSAIPAYTPIPITEQYVLPSVTATGGEVIRDTLQGTLKRHYLVAPGPGQPRATKALLWLAGSGAEPQNFTKILSIAASAGYLGISLAYDNETSVAELCSSTTNPTCDNRMNLECGDQVRHELAYGRDLYDSPCVDVPRADSIENRIVRLVQYVDRMFPAVGARTLLNASGDGLDWSQWAVGGWSQGGGHAGLLAGEHLVARTIYMSKAGDSAPCPLTTTDPNRDCDANGDGVFDPNNEDEMLVPTPAASRPRLTPGERQFGFVHELESAWSYSRETFALYGMGGKPDSVRIDPIGPYPAGYADFQCRNVFSIVAPANGIDRNDYHKSMAVDGVMALDANGQPILAPGILYALTVPVP